MPEVPCLRLFFEVIRKTMALNRLFILGLGLLSFFAHSHLTNCPQIIEPNIRLECYDLAHEDSSEAVSRSSFSTESESEGVLDSLDLDRVGDKSSLGGSYVTPSSSSFSVDASEKPEIKPLTIDEIGKYSEKSFGIRKKKDKNKTRRDVQATIERLVKVWPDDRRRYFLSNDQVWEQTRTKVVDIKAQDKVTILAGRLAGFLLVAEGGASVRVRRIK